MSRQHRASPAQGLRRKTRLAENSCEKEQGPWAWLGGRPVPGVPRGRGSPPARREGADRPGAAPRAAGASSRSPAGIPGRGRPIVWRILIGEGRRALSQTSANPCPRLGLGFPRGGEGQGRKTGPQRRAGSVCARRASARSHGSCVSVHSWPGPTLLTRGPRPPSSLHPSPSPLSFPSLPPASLPCFPLPSQQVLGALPAPALGCAPGSRLFVSLLPKGCSQRKAQHAIATHTHNRRDPRELT